MMNYREPCGNMQGKTEGERLKPDLCSRAKKLPMLIYIPECYMSTKDMGNS